MANLAFFLQVFQGFENVVPLNDIYTGVVELVDVYPVGLKTLKALFAGVSDELGLEVLRFLLVSDAGGEGVEVVADLRAKDDVIALALEGFSHDFLVEAGAVLVGGIEEVDAKIKGFVDEFDGILFADVAPPVTDQGPSPETGLGNS